MGYGFTCVSVAVFDRRLYRVNHSASAVRTIDACVSPVSSQTATKESYWTPGTLRAIAVPVLPRIVLGLPGLRFGGMVFSCNLS